MLTSGGQDRSIRRWERTSEPFFVEEEKERRLESLFEADLEQQQHQGSMILGPQGGTFSGAAAAGEEGAAAAAGRKTGESVSAADSIMDALDVAAHEADKQQEHAAAVAIAKVRGAAHRKLCRGCGSCQSILLVSLLSCHASLSSSVLSACIPSPQRN
jgi:U3 small nucleolar RNA-associated protein 12